MKHQLTEIAYILDRSGSMSPLTKTAIASFNSFAKEQKDGPGEANLTLALFDDEYLTPHLCTPLSEVSDLTTETYVPRGCTALLDAIGTTIDTLGKRLALTPEEERPGHVVVAIFTDGRENASTIYSPQRINKMISHQREVYSWEFIFLAANQDAIATAARMGIGAHAAATIDHSDLGTTAASAALSKSILESRKQSFFEGKVCEYQKASMLEHYEDSLDEVL